MLVVTTKRLYNVELNVIDDKSAQQPAFQVSYAIRAKNGTKRAGRRRPDSASGSRSSRKPALRKR
jgi:type IV secretion system protein VirB9